MRPDLNAPAWIDESREVSDGYESTRGCHRSDCDIQVVRPGKVQCRGESDAWGCWQSWGCYLKPEGLRELLAVREALEADLETMSRHYAMANELLVEREADRET